MATAATLAAAIDNIFLNPDVAGRVDGAEHTDGEFMKEADAVVPTQLARTLSQLVALSSPAGIDGRATRRETGGEERWSEVDLRSDEHHQSSPREDGECHQIERGETNGSSERDTSDGGGGGGGGGVEGESCDSESQVDGSKDSGFWEGIWSCLRPVVTLVHKDSHQQVCRIHLRICCCCLAA